MTFHPTRVVIGAAVTAFSLTAILAVAPPKPPNQLTAYITMHAQKLDVSSGSTPTPLARDGYDATAGWESYVRGGTNYDWAKLVLYDGGFPITDANVTVF